VKLLFIEEGTGVGGSHISLLSLVTGLVARGVRAVVSLPAPHPWYERFREAGAEVHFVSDRPQAETAPALPRKPAPPWTTWPIYRTLSFYREHRRVHRAGVAAWTERIRAAAPDLVQTNNALPLNLEAAVAAAGLGLPIVPHLRGFQPLRGPHRAFLSRMTLGIAISDVIRRHYLDAGAPADRIVRVYDGLEIERYAFREPRADVPARGGRVLYLGRLVGWKGAPVLLDALDRLRTTRPELQCTIAGDGPARAEWEADVARRGLAAHVRFAGFVKDVVPLLHESDVLVHTSIAPEPLGRVTLEGMATGTPVVASAHGASPELVSPGVSGWLSRPGDGGALAERIEEALAAGDRRVAVARAARARVESDFTIDTMVTGTMAAFEQAVGARPDAAARSTGVGGARGGGR
jgi:glycosyltransferase involved in cell wall biosynthesis